jgi:hypothetical protein
MEEVTTREHSSDSIATSEEFEDLGHKNAPELKPNEEMLNTHQIEEKKITSKTSPEMEIGNNGNMADLKETLNEVLNEESETNGIIRIIFVVRFSSCLHPLNVQ